MRLFFFWQSLVSDNALFQSIQRSRSQWSLWLVYLETYLLGALHLSLFLAITMDHVTEDAALLQVMEAHKGTRIAEFDVDRRLTDMPDELLNQAVQQLASLGMVDGSLCWGCFFF